MLKNVLRPLFSKQPLNNGPGLTLKDELSYRSWQFTSAIWANFVAKNLTKKIIRTP